MMNAVDPATLGGLFALDTMVRDGQGYGYGLERPHRPGAGPRAVAG
jgi:hypothetical protein